MWTRAELKSAGKALMNAKYWPSVITSLILGVCLGGSSSSSGSSARNSIDDAGGLSGLSMEEFIAVMLIVILAVSVAIIFSSVFKIFILNPLAVGAYKFFATADQEDTVWTSCILAPARANYKNVILNMFLRDLFIALWSLLFIIPGIIKGYEYRMIPYLLSENPSLDRQKAFELSKQMMDGNKMNAFLLDLSFIGWGILSLLTCGILSIFYVSPYINHTNAELYRTLKNTTTI